MDMIRESYNVFLLFILYISWSSSGTSCQILSGKYQFIAEQGQLAYIVFFIYSMVMNTRTTIQSALSLVFVLAVAIGGYFYPLVGFAVPLVMLVAIVMTLFKPKSFCAYACPRGKALGLALKPFSRGKPIPAGLITPGIKRALCSFMMFCMIGSAARYAKMPVALGTFFWAVCAISLAAGVSVGLIYRPRAWCALCPMGTLQETIGAVLPGKHKTT
jgi:hypothetical protein